MICVAIPFYAPKFPVIFLSPPSTHIPKTPPTLVSLHPLNEQRKDDSAHILKKQKKKPFVGPPAAHQWGRGTATTGGGGSEVVVVGGAQAHDGREMWALCGFGFWMQGFRCFPWLALNFHMAHGLGLGPAVLQLVQHAVNLPLVAKPVFGLLSDAVEIGGAHRVPYISIGAFLQAISWGMLALIPTAGGTFPTLMACILLSNLGASVTEVVSDALVAEYSKTQKAGELQSYAFIALAAGALLGNLSGGFVLLKTQEPKTMFLTFALLLAIQLALSLSTKETSIPSPNLVRRSISENISKQFSELVAAINEESIFYPLLWVVASTALVPLLSGSLFCFQTQCLNLDPCVIGLSKVVGQLMVLSATVFYHRYLKGTPMRKLIFGVQTAYALSFLLDLALAKQLNINLGISNEVYVLCFSAVAEAVAQFKILPFSVLFSSLCPAGCEASLFAFFASALCLAGILSGFLGVGLASFIGVSSGDYSSLPMGIVMQILAALVPLRWIACVPNVRVADEMKNGGTRYKTC